MENIISLSFFQFQSSTDSLLIKFSKSARREILSRLLRLNHERWEEEQKAVAEEVKSVKNTKGWKKSKSTDGQMGLL